MAHDGCTCKSYLWYPYSLDLLLFDALSTLQIHKTLYSQHRWTKFYYMYPGIKKILDQLKLDSTHI